MLRHLSLVTSPVICIYYLLPVTCVPVIYLRHLLTVSVIRRLPLLAICPVVRCRPSVPSLIARLPATSFSRSVVICSCRSSRATNSSSLALCSRRLLFAACLSLLAICACRSVAVACLLTCCLLSALVVRGRFLSCVFDRKTKRSDKTCRKRGVLRCSWSVVRMKKGCLYVADSPFYF